MSITVQDRLLRMIDVVGEAGTSAMVQKTLEVSAEHPDIERVVGVSAAAFLAGAEAEDGRVVVRGKANLALVYAVVLTPDTGGTAEAPAVAMADAEAGDAVGAMGEEEVAWAGEHHRRQHRAALHCVDFRDDGDFDVVLDLPEARAGMAVAASVEVEHCAHNLVNRRRVGVDISVAVKVRVDHLVECKAVTDVLAIPPDRVSLKKERYQLCNVVADQYQEREVEAVVVLPDTKPDVAAIADLATAVKDVMARTEDGRVVVEGKLDASLTYTCEATGMMPLHNVQAPGAGRFSHAMAIAGTRAGHMADTDVHIRDVNVIMHDHRTVRALIKLGIKVRILELHQVDFVTDATSDTQEIDVRKHALHLEAPVGEGGRDAVVAGTLNLPPTKPPVDSIVRAGAVFVPSEIRVVDDKAVVEGDLSLRVVYVGALVDQPVHMVDFPKGLHVTQTIDLPGLRVGMAAKAEVVVAAVEVECLDADSMQCKVGLKVKVKCVKVVAVELICELVVVSPCPPGTSMRLVVVQPGDTLWKISRRYGTTIEAIAKLNNITNPDVIDVGQRLKIPCVAAGPIIEGKG